MFIKIYIMYTCMLNIYRDNFSFLKNCGKFKKKKKKFKSKPKPLTSILLIFLILIIDISFFNILKNVLFFLI